MIMLQPATALFLAVMLAPSGLMRIAAERPDRRAATAVLLCDLSATIGPLIRLWREFPPDMARALDLLSGLTGVAWAWLAAGLGWLLTEALIFCAWRWLASQHTREAAEIQRKLDKLIEEWGEE